MVKFFDVEAMKSNDLGSPLGYSVGSSFLASDVTQAPSLAVNLQSSIRLPQRKGMEGIVCKDPKNDNKLCYTSGFLSDVKGGVTSFYDGGPRSFSGEVTSGYYVPYVFGNNLFVLGGTATWSNKPVLTFGPATDGVNPTKTWSNANSYAFKYSIAYYLANDEKIVSPNAFFKFTYEMGGTFAALREGIQFFPEIFSKEPESEAVSKESWLVEFRPPNIKSLAGFNVSYKLATADREIKDVDGVVIPYFDVTQTFTGAGTFALPQGLKLKLKNVYAKTPNQNVEEAYITSAYAYGWKNSASVTVGGDIWNLGKKGSSSHLSLEEARLDDEERAYLAKQFPQIGAQLDTSNLDWFEGAYMADADGNLIQDADGNPIPYAPGAKSEDGYDPKSQITNTLTLSAEAGLPINATNWGDTLTVAISYAGDPKLKFKGAATTIGLTYEGSLYRAKSVHEEDQNTANRAMVAGLYSNLMGELKNKYGVVDEVQAHQYVSGVIQPYLANNPLGDKSYQDVLFKEFDKNIKGEFGYSFDDFMALLRLCNDFQKSLGDGKDIAKDLKTYADRYKDDGLTISGVVDLAEKATDPKNKDEFMLFGFDDLAKAIQWIAANPNGSFPQLAITAGGKEKVHDFLANWEAPKK